MARQDCPLAGRNCPERNTMTRFPRPALGLLVLAGLAAPTRAAEVDPLLPAETEAVVFVNVRQILESELIKKFALGQIKQALDGADAQKTLKKLGLDPLKDIDRVTAGTWGKDPKDMKGLAVIRGKFDPEKLFGAAQDEAKNDPAKVAIVDLDGYKLVRFTSEKEGQPPVFASVADERTIIASSDKALVASTLTAAKQKAKPAIKKDLAALVVSMDEKASMFVCGTTEGKVDVPPNVNIPGVDGAKLAKQLEGMQNVFLTLRLTQDVGLEIGMGMKNADSADDFGDTVAQLVGTAKAFLPILTAQQPMAKPLVDDLTKSLKSKVKDKDVTITLKLSGDSISQLAGRNAD